MPKLLLNMRGINADVPEPVPEGVYTVVFDTSESQLEKSANNKPNFAVWLTIEGHPQYAGRRIRDWFYTNREALWRLKRVLKILGYPAEDLESDAMPFDTDALHGEAIRAKIGRAENPRTGAIYNVVLDYLPLPEGGSAPAPAAASEQAVSETAPVGRPPRRRYGRDF